MSKTREKLTDELLFLYNTGKLYHAYRTFGAHIEDGGVQFTLWAPDVRSVRVTGDFNGWGVRRDGTHRRHGCLDVFCAGRKSR